MKTNAFDIKVGMKFEDDIMYIFKSTLSSGSVIDCTGTKDDIFKGTDAIIYGIRVDFTTNFSKKSHMVKLPESINLGHCGVDINFGVRTGNSHKGYTKFEEPVLVIGVDADAKYIHTWMDAIIETIKTRINEIIDIGQDQFLDYCETHALI